MDPLHPTTSSTQSAEHALGDLLRILSTIPAPDGDSRCISAEDFRLWFLERFGIAARDCQTKVFGEAIGYGMRLGLIQVERIVRTKAKRIFYTGIDRPILDALCDRWSGSPSLPMTVPGGIPCNGGTPPPRKSCRSHPGTQRGCWNPVRWTILPSSLSGLI